MASVDYKVLLTKYMEVIAQVEGITFVSECSTSPDARISFTVEELSALEEIENYQIAPHDTVTT